MVQGWGEGITKGYVLVDAGLGAALLGLEMLWLDHHCIGFLGEILFWDPVWYNGINFLVRTVWKIHIDRTGEGG